MTAPVLAYKKFYVVNPKASTNQIKNPTFASPDFEEDWTAYGAGYTIEETGDEQRFGAYSMKVNTANMVIGGAYHQNLSVTNGATYTFSCYIKGVAGQAMQIEIRQSTAVKATTTFTSTGYWQRVEVTYTAPGNASDYRAYVIRNAVASVEPFYVDGAQFEQASKATTFFDGYSAGCRWTGTIRNSPSERSANTGLGGELVDLDTYCKVVQVTGLGHGDWNQILTKMTSGGDMYQTHIRKSRNFSIIVDFLGNSLSEIEANRAAVIDLLRPDKLSNLPVNEQFGINWGADSRGHEQRVVRYQGVDVNGNEATNPVDIVCVPLSASMVDTPDLPTYQRAILNFTIPSGLLQGAYNDGAVLDMYADFPAEFIVKRDKYGNWCKFNGSSYDNALKGQGTVQGLNGAVFCMAEGPDGKIYVGGDFTNAGGVSAADYIARWNPVTEQWEAVGAPAFGPASRVNALAFDAAGNLYAGGGFLNAQGVPAADYIAKFDGTNWSALGTGTNGSVNEIAISPEGELYAGGFFTSAGGVANTSHIAKWNGTAWSALSTGLSAGVLALAFAPNGDLYIGGDFVNATGANGDFLCYWDGSAFHMATRHELHELTGSVRALAFGRFGRLYIGGFEIWYDENMMLLYNGGLISMQSKTDSTIYSIAVDQFERVHVGGAFSTIGGLTNTDRCAVWYQGAWLPLDIDLPGNAEIYSFCVASDRSLYIGGNFSTVGKPPYEDAKTSQTVEVDTVVAGSGASANTYPYIQVHGPGTLQAITNYTTGKSVMFDGLTLQAGEWIGLQFDPLNLKFMGGWSGRGNLMRYVVPGSDYGDFYLKPGSNALSMFMTDTTSASGATIAWTPLFWGLDGALL